MRDPVCALMPFREVVAWGRGGRGQDRIRGAVTTVSFACGGQLGRGAAPPPQAHTRYIPYRPSRTHTDACACAPFDVGIVRSVQLEAMASADTLFNSA